MYSVVYIRPIVLNGSVSHVGDLAILVLRIIYFDQLNSGYFKAAFSWSAAESL